MKNIRVNIGNILFLVEEMGYQRLLGYLHKIRGKKPAGCFSPGQEEVQDIITEVFLEKLSREKQVINQGDIDYLIRVLEGLSPGHPYQYGNEFRL
jgi:hypothetical protein